MVILASAWYFVLYKILSIRNKILVNLFQTMYSQSHLFKQKFDLLHPKYLFFCKFTIVSFR